MQGSTESVSSRVRRGLIGIGDIASLCDHDRMLLHDDNSDAHEQSLMCTEDFLQT